MQKIDFVVTWVDGEDREWQRDKAYWYAQEHGKSDVTEYAKQAAGDMRYRTWDTLKYWFRAVEAFAPWVNQIFFVTCGQIPDWMNTEAPKLVTVSHKEFIPQKYLPTFNSQAIELFFHKIPGLSEHFVYFNDDCFLTAPVCPEDFFRNNLPADCAMRRQRWDCHFLASTIIIFHNPI